MGSRAKKIKKNITNMKAQSHKESGTVAERKEIAAVIEKAAAFKNEQKYDEALSVMIEMFNKGRTSPGLFYETADVYYMAGDYNRSAVWAKKTLEFDINHLSAQLLMAKLYAMEDKQKECFKMLEFLLKGHQDISQEVSSEIDDLLLYFQADYEDADLTDRYPSLAAFLRTAALWKGIDEENDAEAQQDTVVEQELAKSSSKDVKGKMESENEDAEKVICEIMKRQISLLEKLDACLDIAMEYYKEKDLVKSLLLLKQALLIDGTNELALRNSAVVLIEMGEKAGALEILSNLKRKDFMVLRQIDMLVK